MKKLYEDLYQIYPAYEQGLTTCAYYLKTANSNILFYNTDNLKELESLLIDYQFLSHRHEATPILKTIKENFSLKLCADKIEKNFIEKFEDIDIIFGKEKIEGIKIIDTPGHTSGGVCFYYQSPYGKNYLFTGDTYFLWDKRLSTLVLKKEGGNKKDLINSLKKLKKLKVDVILCSASVGLVQNLEINKKDWENNIDRSIKELKS